ncbi:hypothetical protein EW146_g8067 [Bondarzewia mesenterica]|uniref:Uncharacterized protein n=1 Tax=Bondarzewia mesenterica TaxID=1095465 RepID=A0A4S4LMY2_9AGAM|nr:hypothetical protein EW146_g8067 [Bondarzewia mesenterica]
MSPLSGVQKPKSLPSHKHKGSLRIRNNLFPLSAASATRPSARPSPARPASFPAATKKGANVPFFTPPLSLRQLRPVDRELAARDLWPSRSSKENLNLLQPSVRQLLTPPSSMRTKDTALVPVLPSWEFSGAHVPSCWNYARPECLENDGADLELDSSVMMDFAPSDSGSVSSPQAIDTSITTALLPEAQATPVPSKAQKVAEREGFQQQMEALFKENTVTTPRARRPVTSLTAETLPADIFTIIHDPETTALAPDVDPDFAPLPKGTPNPFAVPRRRWDAKQWEASRRAACDILARIAEDVELASPVDEVQRVDEAIYYSYKDCVHVCTAVKKLVETLSKHYHVNWKPLVSEPSTEEFVLLWYAHLHLLHMRGWHSDLLQMYYIALRGQCGLNGQ